MLITSACICVYMCVLVYVHMHQNPRITNYKPQHKYTHRAATLMIHPSL